MKERRYEAGALIFQEADVSDTVLRIESGRVEVFREVGGSVITLGRVGPSDFLGEMGVMLDSPRFASARAEGAVKALCFDRAEFLEFIGNDRASSRALIIRLSERLRRANALLSAADGASPASFPPPARARPVETVGETPEPQEPAQRVDGLSVRIMPGTLALAQLVPRAGVVVEAFPFYIGRASRRRSSGSSPNVNLALPDQRPLRLSRSHFVIERVGPVSVSGPGSASGISVRDVGSALGTEVNGVYLGQNFGKDSEMLRVGENVVRAGGAESPFCFKLIVAPKDGADSRG